MQSEAKKNREAQDRIHEENLAAQKRALQQAEYDRQQREYERQVAQDEANQRVRVLAESNVSSEDAYRFGLNYLSFNYGAGKANPNNLLISIDEYGSLRWTWSDPYVLPHLQQSFSAGLQESLSKYNGPGREYIESMAYAAGYEISKGLLGTSFTLGSNHLVIEGVEINTHAYSTNLTTTINEYNGVLEYQFSAPFQDAALNAKFSAGMNAGTQEMNTELLKKERLRVEVPEIQKQRKKDASHKAIYLVWSALNFIVPVIAWILAWKNTEGWQCFLTIVLYIPLVSFINFAVYASVYDDPYSNQDTTKIQVQKKAKVVLQIYIPIVVLILGYLFFGSNYQQSVNPQKQESLNEPAAISRIAEDIKAGDLREEKAKYEIKSAEVDEKSRDYRFRDLTPELKKDFMEKYFSIPDKAGTFRSFAYLNLYSGGAYYGYSYHQSSADEAASAALNSCTDHVQKVRNISAQCVLLETTRD
jgi:hypothetical protein